MKHLVYRVIALGVAFLFIFPLVGFAEKVVVIDPGHGGKHTGTCGATREPNKDICERDVNLQVSLKLRDSLRAAGFKVYMTRETDMHFSPYLKLANGDTTGGDFDIRMQIANKYAVNNNDNTVFISVHHNGHPTSTYVKGYETYYYDGINNYKPEWPADPLAIKYTPDNKRLAESIHPNVVKDTGMIDRKIHNDQSFYVIRNAQMPGVLVELGYMTNREEESLIKSYDRQKKNANAITKGVINYFKVFEVFRNGTKIGTYKTKDEAIIVAQKQQGSVKVFDKYQQINVWDNNNFDVYHRHNGMMGSFATLNEAITFAQQRTYTRVVERATKWTIWSNFLTKKYQIQDQNSIAIGIYYDLDQAIKTAQTQANRKIVLASNTNEVVWSNISGVSVTRIVNTKKVAGADRYETANAVSKELYPNGFESNKQQKTVILSTGKEFADALSTGPLSVKYGNAPILLTEPTKLNLSAKNELVRLGAKNVVIIGGPAAISSSVEQEVKALGISTNRIAGIDRYETNEKVLSQLGTNVNGVFVASATSFPDALAAAPIAAANNWAIILTSKNSITTEALSYMKGKKIVILGGTAVVSDQVKNQILSQNSSSNVVRLGGAERYDTLAALLWYFRESVKSNTVYVSTGQNFPDALASAPLSISNKAPLILVSNNVNHNVQSFLMKYSEENTIKNVRSIGGVVTDSTINSIVSTLK